MAKSRGLFPGPKSIPKRSFASAAGNSSSDNRPGAQGPHTHDYRDGMLGWRGSRPGGGEKFSDKNSDRPKISGQGELLGDGGLAWDSSAAIAMSDKGKTPS
jgi:hypothetical protein